MARQPHKEWQVHVAELKASLDASPADLTIATEYWTAISGSAGYDVRNGKRLVDTFRTCALRGDDGLERLLSAFRELADDSGEYPRVALFDPPLENLLRIVASQPDHPLSTDAQWLLDCINND